MKKIFLAIAPLAIIAMAFTTGGSLSVGDPLAIGAPLPKAEVKMMDVNGKLKTMKEAAGNNGLLVMFSCNTCPYVVKNQERTKEISEYALKMNVGVILLNSNEAYRAEDDSYEAMKAYAKDQKFKWSYVIDKNHEVADAFGANRTPEIFLFDKDMKLAYHGAIDDNPSDGSAVKRQHLKEAIGELVAGKDISVKESRSVGCSIKRNK